MTDIGSSDHSRPIGAILIPLLSIIAILLDIPPIIWHARNRNIGSTSLILWLIVLNSCNFLNALIWPRDDLSNWWKGQVYCDIQVRLIIGGAYGGLPGAVLCIMKALARVLDSKRTVVNASTTDRRRQHVLDGLLCLGLPILFMMVLYIVHAYRYYIVGIMGCDTPLDRSWVTFALLFIWPPIILIISSYYASESSLRMIRPLAL
jgi:pheromone a factor receptor